MNKSNLAKIKIPSTETLDLISKSLRYETSSGLIYWVIQYSSRGVKGSMAGYINSRGYRVIRLNKVNYLAHRLAWFLGTGTWPSHEVDHINGDQLDNRLSNLRNVIPSYNQHNRKSHRNGTPLGACFHHGVWEAYAPRNYGKFRSKGRIYIGRFKTKEEAGQAVVEYCKINEEK